MKNFWDAVSIPWRWLNCAQNASATSALAAVTALIGLYFYTRYTRRMMLMQQETLRATITPLLVTNGPINFIGALTPINAALKTESTRQPTAFQPNLMVKNVGEGAATYITSWMQEVTEKFEMGSSELLVRSPQAKQGNLPLSALLKGESIQIKFDLIGADTVKGRLLFVIQCLDPADGVHQLQLLYSNWPTGDVQMTMVHGPLKP